jgi:hypothetical protein
LNATSAELLGKSSRRQQHRDDTDNRKMRYFASENKTTKMTRRQKRDEPILTGGTVE